MYTSIRAVINRYLLDGYQDSRFKIQAASVRSWLHPRTGIYIYPRLQSIVYSVYFRVADLAPFKSPLKTPMHEKPSQYRISSSPGMHGASATNPIPTVGILRSSGLDTRLLRCHGSIARAIRGVKLVCPQRQAGCVPVTWQNLVGLP